MPGGQSVGARNGKSEVSHQEVGSVQKDLKRGRKVARKKGAKLVGGKQENLEWRTVKRFMTADSKSSLEVEKNYAKEFAREITKTSAQCKGRGSLLDRAQQRKGTTRRTFDQSFHFILPHRTFNMPSPRG